MRRPALSNTTAALRGGGGCTDTDVNESDFAGATPAPRNSATAAAPCSGGPPPPRRRLRRTPGWTSTSSGVLSISLEKQSISFGNALAGDSPAAGLRARHGLEQQRGRLRAHRPPLRLPARRPPARHDGVGADRRSDRRPLAGGAKAAIPIAPAPDLLIGTTSARSATGGDAWPTSVSFVSALPVVPAGPLHGDGHVHGHRPMTGGVLASVARSRRARARARVRFGGRERGQRPPVALTASPAHVELAGYGRLDGASHELGDESRRRSTCAGRASRSICAAPADRRDGTPGTLGCRAGSASVRGRSSLGAGRVGIGDDRVEGSRAGRARRSRRARPLHDATSRARRSRRAGAHGRRRGRACAGRGRATPCSAGSSCRPHQTRSHARARRGESRQRDGVVHAWPRSSSPSSGTPAALARLTAATAIAPAGHARRAAVPDPASPQGQRPRARRPRLRGRSHPARVPASTVSVSR